MVLKGFGSGERFPSSKDPTPGPGAYDPKADLGGKVDPRSGFLTGDRFQDSQDGQSAGSTGDISPPRERKKVDANNGRNYKWTAQQIHDLRLEIDTLKAKLKDAEKEKGEAAAQCEQQAAELTRLTTQTKDLQTELACLVDVKANLDIVTADKNKLAVALQSAQAKVALLTQQLDSTQLSGNEWQQKSEQHRLQLEETTKTLTERTSAVKDLEKRLNEQTKSVTWLESQLAEAREEIQHALSVAHTKEQTAEAVGQELASSVEQIILLEASRTKLQGELMAAQQEGAKARMQLQTCEQLAEEDRAELERTRALLQERERDGEASAAQLLAAQRQLDTRQTELRNAHDRVTSLEGEVKTLNTSVQSLNKELAASRAALAAETALLVAERTNTTTLTQQLTDEQTKSHTLTSQLQELQIKLQTAESALHDTQAKQHATDTELSTTLAQLAATQALVTEKASGHQAVAKQLSEKSGECDALKEECDRVRGECERVTKERDAAREEVQTTLGRMDAEKAAHDMQIGLLEARITKLTEDAAAHTTAASARADRDTEALRSAEQRAAEAAARADALAAELSATQEALTRVDNDREASVAMVASVQAQLEAVRGELAQAVEAHTETQAQLDEALTEARELQMRLLEEDRVVCQLRAEMQSTRTLLETACRENEGMQEELLCRQGEIDKAQASLRQAQAQLQDALALEQEVSSAYAKLNTAQDSAAAAQQHAAELQLQLDQLIAKYGGVDINEKEAALAREMEKANERVSAAERAATQARAEASAAQTQLLELRRLQDENELLTQRQTQLEGDMKNLVGSSGAGVLGHNNTKQKIQYHLKLKQELEEMRAELTVLLREKFHLEQCVRYLAVRSRLAGPTEQNAMGTRERRVTDRLLPMSLAQSPMFSTPIGQRSMKLAARARGADTGTVYGPQGNKETFEAAINDACRRATHEMEELAALEADTAAATATPGPTLASAASAPAAGTPLPAAAAVATPEPALSTPLPVGSRGGADGGGPATAVALVSIGESNSLESRILDKISAVCTPQTRTLLQASKSAYQPTHSTADGTWAPPPDAAGHAEKAHRDGAGKGGEEKAGRGKTGTALGGSFGAASVHRDLMESRGPVQMKSRAVGGATGTATHTTRKVFK